MILLIQYHYLVMVLPDLISLPNSLSLDTWSVFSGVDIIWEALDFFVSDLIRLT